jgi:hypothetical protein
MSASKIIPNGSNVVAIDAESLLGPDTSAKLLSKRLKPPLQLIELAA